MNKKKIEEKNQQHSNARAEAIHFQLEKRGKKCQINKGDRERERRMYFHSSEDKICKLLSHSLSIAVDDDVEEQVDGRRRRGEGEKQHRKSFFYKFRSFQLLP